MFCRVEVLPTPVIHSLSIIFSGQVVPLGIYNDVVLCHMVYTHARMDNLHFYFPNIVLPKAYTIVWTVWPVDEMPSDGVVNEHIFRCTTKDGFGNETNTNTEDFETFLAKLRVTYCKKLTHDASHLREIYYAFAKSYLNDNNESVSLSLETASPCKQFVEEFVQAPKVLSSNIRHIEYSVHKLEFNEPFKTVALYQRLYPMHQQKQAFAGVKQGDVCRPKVKHVEDRRPKLCVSDL